MHYEDIKNIISRLETIAKAPQYQPFPEADEFNIEADENIWKIRGRKAEKITNLKGNSHEILNEISYRFEKSSISQELINQGIKKGDIVDLNGHEFSYE